MLRISLLILIAATIVSTELSAQGNAYTIVDETYSISGSVSSFGCGPSDSYDATQGNPVTDSVVVSCPGGVDYESFSHTQRLANPSLLSLTVEHFTTPPPADGQAMASATVDFTVPVMASLELIPVVFEGQYSCVEATISDLTTGSVFDLVVEPKLSLSPIFCPIATGTEHCCNESTFPYSYRGLDAILTPGHTYRIHLSVDSLESPCSAEISVDLEFQPVDPGFSIVDQTHSGSGNLSLDILGCGPSTSFSESGSFPLARGLVDDFCASPYVLEATSQTAVAFSGTTLVASVTQVSGGPCCLFSSATAELVVDFTVPAESYLVLTPVLLDFSYSCVQASVTDLTSLEVFDMIEPDDPALLPFGCGDTGPQYCCISVPAPYSLFQRTAPLLPGRTYRLELSALDAESDSAATIEIELDVIATVQSDECMSVSSEIGEGEYLFDTTIATTSADPVSDAACPGTLLGDLYHDVWFQYAASTTGPVTVSVCGATFDTDLAMYEGSCGALVSIGCNGDGCLQSDGVTPFASTLDAEVVAGGTYLIRVGGYSTAQDDDGSGVLSIVGVGTAFARGDCNADGDTNVADAISLLSALFSGGSVTCLDACDSNNDGGFDVADGIYLLSFLFSGASEPDAPFPNCGVASLLGCDSFLACP